MTEKTESKFKYQNVLNQKFMDGVNAHKKIEKELFNHMEELLDDENQRAREFEMEQMEKMLTQKKEFESSQLESVCLPNTQ